MKKKEMSEELKQALRAKQMDPRYYAVNKEFPNSAILIDLRSKKPFVIEKN